MSFSDEKWMNEFIKKSSFSASFWFCQWVALSACLLCNWLCLKYRLVLESNHQYRRLFLNQVFHWQLFCMVVMNLAWLSVWKNEEWQWRYSRFLAFFKKLNGLRVFVFLWPGLWRGKKWKILRYFRLFGSETVETMVFGSKRKEITGFIACVEYTRDEYLFCSKWADFCLFRKFIWLLKIQI